MKTFVRNMITLGVLVVVVAGSTAMRAYTLKERRLLTCNGISVEYTDDFRVVSEEDVKQYLAKYYGAYIGQRLDSIRLDRIEEMLDTQSAVHKCQAFITDDRILHIRLIQRVPVVRFKNGSEWYYSDEKGYVFPLQSGYPARLPIIDGNVPLSIPAGYKGQLLSEKERLWMYGAIDMVQNMAKSKVWTENIAQIHVDSQGDLIMIPRQGNETFIFGSPFDAKEKLKKMGDYYKYIVPEKGKDYYSIINLKYDNQIICKK